MRQEIVKDGATGVPIVSGAEVPVPAILERLMLTGSVERVLELFPSLTREGFDAAMRYAAVAVLRPVPYGDDSGVGVRALHEPAVEYIPRITPADAAAEAEAEFQDIRYDYRLAAALRKGFGDLTAGRVTPHAEFMAELRAMIQA
ncbi:MAG TPA: DUF433 domain-containing protein [Longimicrobiaceae bacterium]|nr:DUF433 domain-containing protein [Longimicrobiaceae bacterium]